MHWRLWCSGLVVLPLGLCCKGFLRAGGDDLEQLRRWNF